MSLDGTILAAARRRFLADREARRAELEPPEDRKSVV